MFGLDNTAKISFLEHIPDCLRCDRGRNDGVDELGSLDSITSDKVGWDPPWNRSTHFSRYSEYMYK